MYPLIILCILILLAIILFLIINFPRTPPSYDLTSQNNILGASLPSNGYFQFSGDTVRFGGVSKQGCYFDMVNNPIVKFYTDGTPMNKITITLTSGCYKSESFSQIPSWDPNNNHFSMEYEKGHHLSITFNNVGNNDYNAVVSLTPPGSSQVNKTSQVQATFFPNS